MSEYKRLCEMLDGTYRSMLALAVKAAPPGARVRAPTRAGAVRKQAGTVVRHEVSLRGVDVWVRLESSGRVVSARFEEVEVVV